MLQLLQQTSSEAAALILLRDFELLLELQRHLGRETELCALCSAVKDAAVAAACTPEAARSSSCCQPRLPGPLFRLVQQLAAAALQQP